MITKTTSASYQNQSRCVWQDEINQSINRINLNQSPTISCCGRKPGSCDGLMAGNVSVIKILI